MPPAIKRLSSAPARPELHPQPERQRARTLPRRAALCAALCLLCLLAPAPARAQDTVTGAFEGTVSDSRTGARIPGALAEIVNQATGVSPRRRCDAQGRFYQGLLPPGVYTIRVSAAASQPQEQEQR